MNNQPASGVDKALANMSRFIDVGKIHAIRSNLEQQVAQIRDDRYMSGEGKEMKLAEAFVDARIKMDALRTELEAKVIDERNRLERAAFGPGTVDPMERIAHRDAFDRANRLNDQDDAKQLLAQAKISGDDGLARAIMHRAHSRGWTDAIDTWEQYQPGTVGLINEIRNLPEDNISKTVVFKLDKPSEFRGTGDTLIARYAAKAKYATQADLESPDHFRAPADDLMGKVTEAMGDNPFGTTAGDSTETTAGE